MYLLFLTKVRWIDFIAQGQSFIKSWHKERNNLADKTLASRQSIYESDFVGSTRNALAGQNHRDQRMIEEDSSSRRWHRSHRLQSHVRGKGWQLRWITARHTVSSKLQSCCRERMTLYTCCYDFIVLYLKCAFCQEMIVPSAWIDSRCWNIDMSVFCLY